MVLRYFAFLNQGLVSFLVLFIWINIILFVFNLIPIPPLDGSHILASLLPFEKSLKYREVFSRYGLVSVIFAVFFMIYIASPFIAQPLFALLVNVGPVF